MTSKFGPQVEKLHAVAGSLSGRLVALAGERDLPAGAPVVSAAVHLLELPAGTALLSAPVSAAVHALCFLADDLLVCGTADGRLLAFEPAAGKTAPLLELCAQSNVKLIIAGHWHYLVHESLGAMDEWLVESLTVTDGGTNR